MTENRASGEGQEPTSGRRFPAPWRYEPLASAYVILDATGQRLAYVYFRSTPSTARAAQSLNEDEARRIAANIVRLPELLSRSNP